MTAAGRLMAAGIADQPRVWCRLLDNGTGAIGAATARIIARAAPFVLFVGRGSSGHAALCAKYLDLPMFL